MLASTQRLFIFIAFFVLFELNCYLANDMIMPAMNSVVNSFAATSVYVSLSLSLYILGGALLQIFVGPVADILGKRKVVIFGNVFFLLATLIITLSGTINQFLLARFFQGMGIAFVSLGYAVVHESFNDKNAVRAISIMGNISIMAPLLGPLLGSYIFIATGHWQSIFFVTGVIGLISLMGLYNYMPQPLQVNPNLNLRQIARSYKNILKSKVFVVGVFLIAFGLSPIVSWVGISPILIMVKLKEPVLYYNLFQGIVFGGFILCSILMQKIAGKFKFKNFILVGASLSFVAMLFALINYNNVDYVVIGFFFYAIGIGLYFAIITRLILHSNKESINLNSSLMGLFFLTIMSIILQINNIISNIFNYKMVVFVAICCISSFVVLCLSFIFSYLVRDIPWKV
ncbi:MAG: MFS transporter [Burkholderiales bacterium]|nr:MFS transporter [Burkholderiales bacterium]